MKAIFLVSLLLLSACFAEQQVQNVEAHHLNIRQVEVEVTSRHTSRLSFSITNVGKRAACLGGGFSIRPSTGDGPWTGEDLLIEYGATPLSGASEGLFSIEVNATAVFYADYDLRNVLRAIVIQEHPIGPIMTVAEKHGDISGHYVAGALVTAYACGNERFANMTSRRLWSMNAGFGVDFWTLFAERSDPFYLEL